MSELRVNRIQSQSGLPIETPTGIGFTPAGVGAVATTVQSKLREFVSVKDFGAIGDGVADDTAAIQRAIDACLNGTIHFPVGHYRVSNTLTVRYSTDTHIISVNLCGEGLGSVIIWAGPPSQPVFWYKAVTALQGTFSKTVIEKLHIVTAWDIAGSIGIKIGDFASPLGMYAGVHQLTIRNI